MIHRHKELSSTNDEARRLAESGAPHGTAVQADQQSAGRGRLGRPWISPPGNLYVSVILRPPVDARMAELGFVVALAVADAVDAAVRPAPVTLKWPNDVLVAGAKVAGILMESTGPGVIIAGIGLNVAHAPAGLPYPATAIAHHAPADIEMVLRDLLATLGFWWKIWAEYGLAPILQAWLQRGPRPGDLLAVQSGPDRVNGRFAGLAEDGALLLETQDGPRRIIAGDVV